MSADAVAARRRTLAGDAGCLLAIAGVLSAALLPTYAIHGYAFPVGPDAPVYIWWSRLAGHEGLGAVAGRPGVPALILVISGVLRIGIATTVAALEIALTAVVAAAAAALSFEPGGGRARWVVPAVLSGAFSVLLAVGYVGTLAAAALFLATCAALAVPGRRAVALAVATLAAAGLAHPGFAAIGVAVLFGAAALSALRDHRVRPMTATDHGRVVTLVIAAGAVFAAAMASISFGASPLRAETSRDDVLQRLSLVSALHDEFRRRIVDHAAPFVAEVSIPLAAVGLWSSDGWRGRILRSWAVVAVLGVAAGLATGVIPPERVATFAFVVPIAAGLGLVWLVRRFASAGPPFRRALVGAAGLAGFVAMLAGPMLVWSRTPPQLFPLEVIRATEAGRYASATQPGTPLLFVAKNREPVGAFFATEAANAIRASLPPDRIRDVIVLTPPGPPLAPTAENAALVARSSVAELAAGPRALVFDLAPFDRTDFGGPPPAGRPPARTVAQGVVISGAVPDPVAAPVQPLAPLTPTGLGLGVAGTLALLWIAGSGWVRAASIRGTPGLALAPAIGAAALILGAAVADRVGLHASSPAAATDVAVTVTLLGHVVAIALPRSGRGAPAVPSVA